MRFGPAHHDDEIVRLCRPPNYADLSVTVQVSGVESVVWSAQSGGVFEGRSCRGELRGIARQEMVMSMDNAAPIAAADAIVADFRLWLERERGLSAASVWCYGKQARKFRSWLPDPVDSSVQQLDSMQVTSLVRTRPPRPIRPSGGRYHPRRAHRSQIEKSPEKRGNLNYRSVAEKPRDAIYVVIAEALIPARATNRRNP